MNILIIGNGGRENALAWKFSQDSRINKIYLANGNAGTYYITKAENIYENSISKLVKFAKSHEIHLTIVGSETLLVEGIVDTFEGAGLKIFGANKKAAALEASKRFAKDFMKKHAVKTASYTSFTHLEDALLYLDTCTYPTVIKASGLAAGKGIVVCCSHEEAINAINSIMRDKRFGNAGDEVIIEEFLTGFECSILSFYDGKNLALMLPVKNYKTIGENNTGEYTSGMGVVAPHPSFTTEHLTAFKQDIVIPTLRGLQAENMDFAGVILFGLMVNEKGVYLLEYNMRMGDPETQAILPLMENDLLEPINSAIKRELSSDAFTFCNRHAVCVVAASDGYPNTSKKGFEIKEIGKARFFGQVFIAGAMLENDVIKTNDERVLNVVGVSENLENARAAAYSSIKQVKFENMVYRNDIGKI